MGKISDKLYNAFNKFLTELGGGYIVIGAGIVAIIFAAIGFYGTHGFDWKWFVFFHLPLYIFCGWALWQATKMYKNTLRSIKSKDKENNTE